MLNEQNTVTGKVVAILTAEDTYGTRTLKIIEYETLNVYELVEIYCDSEEGYINLNDKYAFIDFEGDLLTSFNDPKRNPLTR